MGRPFILLVVSQPLVVEAMCLTACVCVSVCRSDFKFRTATSSYRYPHGPEEILSSLKSRSLDFSRGSNSGPPYVTLLLTPIGIRERMCRRAIVSLRVGSGTGTQSRGVTGLEWVARSLWDHGFTK
jgi:hypothetical protein